MRYISLLLLFSFSFAVASIADAAEEDFIQWHSSNVQLLRGHEYRLGSEDRTIITFEHANRWTYGDFFVFADQIWQDGGNSSYYIEPTLRVSLSKVAGRNFSAGLIKDVLLSGQVEMPEGQDERWLAGAAIDLNLPDFAFFKVNMFMRDNPNLSGNTYQVTLGWNRPFQIGKTEFLFEGFADIVGNEGTASAYELIVPRLLVDIGDLSGAKKNKLWLGIEWQYWHNKFGVDDVTESVPQMQLKYVF